MLKYQEKFAAALTTINMHVTKVHTPLVRLAGYVCAEPLSKSSFSSTHLTRYDNSLRHFLWTAQNETEKLHQQTMLFFPVRQPSRYIVYVKLRFIFEHTMPERHVKIQPSQQTAFHGFINLSSV
jgi:hypothetical protein